MTDDSSGKVVSDSPTAETSVQSDQLPKVLLEWRPPADSLAYPHLLRKRDFARESRSEEFGAPPVDDRTGSRPVTLPEIKGFPWNAVCQLTMIYQNGQKAVGTGFLVGPRTVITAGHCVYLPSCGQATRVTVVPARQGGDAPFGWSEATLVDFSQQWRNTNQGAPEPEHDFGAVFLPTATLHQRVGHTLSTAAFTDADVKGISVANVAGYPNRGGSVKMECDDGPLLIDAFHPLNQRILYHLLETHAGQSGGPIIHYNTGTHAITVFGIHTYADNDSNLARRIDPDLAGIIARWVAIPQPFMAGAQIS